MSITETPAAEVLPTHLDLPATDGKPVENAYQPAQSMLLTGALTPILDRFHPDGNYFIGADTGIYWRKTDDPLAGCKAPDWYYVPSVPRMLNGTYRRSYVLWEEYTHPLIVIEYVSGDGSDEHDQTPQTGKFWVYERAIQASYYVIHDPDRQTLEVFELVRGRYRPLVPTEHGRYRIPPMEIDLGIWEGEYQGYLAAWLRAWDWTENLIPTAEDRLEAERLRAEQERRRAEHANRLAESERLRAEQERVRAEKLAAKLRELGVDPDAV